MSDMGDNERSRERSRRDRPSRFAENSRDRSVDRGRDRGSMKSSKNRVYVSNIPYECRWQDLKDLFRNQVGDVSFVELFVDEFDKPKGCGIVEFSDPASVDKCLEKMQRYEVKTRKLIIKEDSGVMRDKQGNIVGSNKHRNRDDNKFRDDRDRFAPLGGSSMQLRQDDKWGNTYGLSPQFLASLNIDGPLCSKVFVANLEYNIDKKKLKEVFSLAGKVLRVDISLDKDGNSRGFAVIEYDHPVEAVQAISMFHDQVLFDRPMTVRMDRANETFKLPAGLKSIGMGLGSNGEPLKNVAHNLPSLSSCTQSGIGASILSNVPSSALQVANALSGLGGGALSGLSNPLQAAGLGNLLGNGLGGGDLPLSNFSNSLVQNSSQLAALTASTGNNNPSQNLSSGNTGNLKPFGGHGHSDNNYGNQSSGFGGQGQNYGGGNRGFQNNYESQKSYGGFGNDRSNNYQMNQSNDNKGGGGGFQRKVMASNVPHRF